MKYNLIFYSIGFLILVISNILVNNNYLDASYENTISSYEIKN